MQPSAISSYLESETVRFSGCCTFFPHSSAMFLELLRVALLPISFGRTFPLSKHSKGEMQSTENTPYILWEAAHRARFLNFAALGLTQTGPGGTDHFSG